MQRGKRFILEDPAAFCADYRAGASGMELAARLGISKHTVYRLLKSHGESLRVSGRERRRLDVDDIVARFNEGWTVSALARQHQCYRPTIRRVLKAAAIPTGASMRRATETVPKPSPMPARPASGGGAAGSVIS